MVCQYRMTLIVCLGQLLTSLYDKLLRQYGDIWTLPECGAELLQREITAEFGLHKPFPVYYILYWWGIDTFIFKMNSWIHPRVILESITKTCTKVLVARCGFLHPDGHVFGDSGPGCCECRHECVRLLGLAWHDLAVGFAHWQWVGMPLTML